MPDPRFGLEGKVAVDMRVVCPKDVKKMLLKQARMVHQRKWAVDYECEECDWRQSKLC